MREMAKNKRGLGRVGQELKFEILRQADGHHLVPLGATGFAA